MSRSLRDAAVAGVRRAGAHLIRAGIEIVSGVAAFLDEVRNREEDDPGLQRIEVVVDDDDEGRQRLVVE